MPASLLPNQERDPAALVEHRRAAGYLKIISSYSERLIPILRDHFWFPSITVERLAISADICSVVRFLGGHPGCGGFSAGVAIDVLEMARSTLDTFF